MPPRETFRHRNVVNEVSSDSDNENQDNNRIDIEGHMRAIMTQWEMTRHLSDGLSIEELREMSIQEIATTLHIPNPSHGVLRLFPEHILLFDSDDEYEVAGLSIDPFESDNESIDSKISFHEGTPPESLLIEVDSLQCKYLTLKRYNERIVVFFNLTVKVFTTYEELPYFGIEQDRKYVALKTADMFVDTVWKTMEEKGSYFKGNSSADRLFGIHKVEDPIGAGSHMLDIEMLSWLTFDIEQQIIMVPEYPISREIFLMDTIFMMAQFAHKIELKSFIKIYRAVLNSVSIENYESDDLIVCYKLVCNLLVKLEEKEVYLLEITYLALNLEKYIEVLSSVLNNYMTIT